MDSNLHLDHHHHHNTTGLDADDDAIGTISTMFITANVGSIFEDVRATLASIFYSTK